MKMKQCNIDKQRNVKYCHVQMTRPSWHLTDLKGLSEKIKERINRKKASNDVCLSSIVT